MTKTERIDRIAERVQLPKYQTEAVVTSVLQFIMDALRTGDKVELRGFGSFRLHCRQSCVGRNPTNRGHGADSRQTGPLVYGGESPPSAGESARPGWLDREQRLFKGERGAASA